MPRREPKGWVRRAGRSTLDLDGFVLDCEETPAGWMARVTASQPVEQPQMEPGASREDAEREAVRAFLRHAERAIGVDRASG